MEAARSSSRGAGWAVGGWAVGGPACPFGSEPALLHSQSHQARAEEAQGASWAPAKGGTLTVLHYPATMHMHMNRAGVASQPKRGFLVTWPARTSAGARKRARKRIWKYRL
jgi:hypothetical protein